MARQFEMDPVLTDVPLFAQGKVRDMFDLGDAFLMVATDRVSAFDVVLPNQLEGKGKILNQLSMYWFKALPFKNHLITDQVDEMPEVLHKYKDYLQGRSMLVKKAERLDIECVVRGYLVGSGWKDYQNTGAVCGHELPADLKLSCKIDPPIFTPAAKIDDGHDENIDFETMKTIVTAEQAEEMRTLSLDIYSKAREIAAEKGIILADTKFEFGIIDGEITLIDEVLTPDSSRYWDAATYAEDKDQDSYDKQVIRNWLSTLDWDKEYPGPSLTDAVIEKSMSKYLEIYKRLTGEEPVL
ncbi:MAG: phosphoribosylaminoimidazolesuccinocarboxamide synthase [Fibrobacterales bacterium]